MKDLDVIKVRLSNTDVFPKTRTSAKQILDKKNKCFDNILKLKSGAVEQILQIWPPYKYG